VLKFLKADRILELCVWLLTQNVVIWDQCLLKVGIAMLLEVCFIYSCIVNTITCPEFWQIFCFLILIPLVWQVSTVFQVINQHSEFSSTAIGVICH